MGKRRNQRGNKKVSQNTKLKQQNNLNLWNAAKVLRGNFIMINAYIKKI